MPEPQHTFVIDAVKNCLTNGVLKTTDITLKEGQLLIVNVDPKQTWTLGTDSGKLSVNANGISVDKINGLYKKGDFEFALGSLIGTLDGGLTYFPVGTHLEMTVLRDSPLSFLFWGGDQNKNEGFVRATVEVPESSNYAVTHPSVVYDKDQAKYFDVNARVNSCNGGTPLNTGIELEPGDLLIVNVDPKDLWNLMQDVRSWDINANGVNKDCPGYVKGEALPKWPNGYLYLPKNNFLFRYGGLIGTLDEGKTFFPVGTHLEMTVLSKGTLSFVCWDCDYLDNRGFIRTFVKLVKKAAPIAQPPENVPVPPIAQPPENVPVQAAPPPPKVEPVQPIAQPQKVEPAPTTGSISVNPKIHDLMYKTQIDDKDNIFPKPPATPPTKKVSYTFTPSGNWYLSHLVHLKDYPEIEMNFAGLPKETVEKKIVDNLKYPHNKPYALLAERRDGTGEVIQVIEVTEETTIHLEPGEILTFLVNDEESKYSDNDGKLTVNYRQVDS